jgi:hypothetical protein
MKTATIKLESIKETDGWFELAYSLGYKEKEIYDIFEYGEFADLTIEVDENLNIVGGKIHRHKSKKNEN